VHQPSDEEWSLPSADKDDRAQDGDVTTIQTLKRFCYIYAPNSFKNSVGLMKCPALIGPQPLAKFSFLTWYTEESPGVVESLWRHCCQVRNAYGMDYFFLQGVHGSVCFDSEVSDPDVSFLCLGLSFSDCYMKRLNQ
jgi:hypothetical protein